MGEALAALVGLVVGLVLGLWWGERGRRLAAEALAVTGSFERSPARHLPAPPSMEELVTSSAGRLTQSMTPPPGAPTRLAAWLRDRARERGLTLSDHDALAHANELVRAAEEPDV